MKIIFRHIVFVLTVSTGMGVFYINGFSHSSWLIVTAIAIIGGVIELGMTHGLNKPLPKRKASELIISIIRKVFGFILAIIAIRTIGLDQLESLLNSKSFLLGLWLWIMVEAVFRCMKEYRMSRQDPNNGLRGTPDGVR